MVAVLYVLLWVSSADAAQLRLVLGGDLYLGSWVEGVVEREGAGYPWGDLKDILERADVRVANLEAPFTTAQKEFMEKEYLFRVAPGLVEVLKKGGIDVVTLANNHIMDYGMEGLEDTLEVLASSGIGHVGAGTTMEEARRAWIMERAGIRVAFLAYSNTFPKKFYADTERGGTARGLAGFVREDVREARKASDFVVVSFHWGEEGMKEPKPYQRRLARVAIDSGAAVVVGHHPHVLQPIELYKGGIIAYSVGNLVFASYSTMEPEGMLLEVVLRKDAHRSWLHSFRVIPLDVDNRRVNFRPIPKTEGIMSCRLTPERHDCSGYRGTVSFWTGGDQKD